MRWSWVWKGKSNFTPPTHQFIYKLGVFYNSTLQEQLKIYFCLKCKIHYLLSKIFLTSFEQILI